jgi:hypothetical protein
MRNARSVDDVVDPSTALALDTSTPTQEPVMSDPAKITIDDQPDTDALPTTRHLVMPEVVEAFPDHEILGTDTQSLPCKLTESERLAKGHQLAQLAGELEGHRVDAKRVKAELKEQEERIASAMHDVAKDLRRGAEDRVISTCVLADYRTNEAKTVRQDTCEVLWSRSLTPDERQRVLFPDRKTQSAGDNT